MVEENLCKATGVTSKEAYKQPFRPNRCSCNSRICWINTFRARTSQTEPSERQKKDERLNGKLKKKKKIRRKRKKMLCTGQRERERSSPRRLLYKCSRLSESSHLAADASATRGGTDAVSIPIKMKRDK